MDFIFVFFIGISFLFIIMFSRLTTETQVSNDTIVIKLSEYKKDSNNKLVINLLKNEIYAVMGYDSDNSIAIPDNFSKGDFEEFNISDSTDEKIIIKKETTKFDNILSYFEFLDHEKTSTKTYYKLYLNKNSIQYD